MIAQLDAAGLNGKIKLGTPSAAPGGNIGPKEWSVAPHTSHWPECTHSSHTTRTAVHMTQHTPDAVRSHDRFAQFFGNCTGCHFDFLCFHIYDCNSPWFDAGAVNYWLGQVKGFGLPIWLTEFDCPSNSVANELTWMDRVLSSLDSDPQVERYRRSSLAHIPHTFFNWPPTSGMPGSRPARPTWALRLRCSTLAPAA